VKRERAGALYGYVGFSESEIVDFEHGLEGTMPSWEASRPNCEITGSPVEIVVDLENIIPAGSSN
jgi:hypothetical protein